MQLVSSNLHLFLTLSNQVRNPSAEQQLHWGRGLAVKHPAEAPLLCPAMRQGGYPVHEVVFSHHLIQWPTNSRACFWHQGDVQLSGSCVLASSLFHTTVSKVFGQGTDRNGRVIYCKTPSLFAQLKPLFFLFLCYRQISHHLEWGVCETTI